jgi:ribonuclease HII
MIVEEKIKIRGFNSVVGIDEAGRGSLAGPVVAATVHISSFNFFKNKTFKDSKKISAKKREYLFNEFSLRPEINWGIGVVSEKKIDKLNILNATKLAMKKSIINLQKLNIKPDFILIDGNFLLDTGINEKFIIKGDEKIISCKVAGIVAKVYRDRLLIKISNKYPEYFLDQNKGYGTKKHILAIKKNGYSKIHRKSFKV